MFQRPFSDKSQAHAQQLQMMTATHKAPTKPEEEKKFEKKTFQAETLFRELRKSEKMDTEKKQKREVYG